MRCVFALPTGGIKKKKIRERVALSWTGYEGEGDLNASPRGEGRKKIEHTDGWNSC